MIDFIKIMAFLNDFSKNNNREWFHTHTLERKQMMSEFEKFIEDLEIRIANFDETILYYPPKDLIFKQVKDTRFSKDNTPYNPSFRAHIAPKGKPIPVGYYICIKPNNESFIGGGFFTDIFSKATNDIRDSISNHEKEFIQIISNNLFMENFIVEGN